MTSSALTAMPGRASGMASSPNDNRRHEQPRPDRRSARTATPPGAARSAASPAPRARRVCPRSFLALRNRCAAEDDCRDRIQLVTGSGVRLPGRDGPRRRSRPGSPSEPDSSDASARRFAHRQPGGAVHRPAGSRWHTRGRRSIDGAGSRSRQRQSETSGNWPGLRLRDSLVQERNAGGKPL